MASSFRLLIACASVASVGAVSAITAFDCVTYPGAIQIRRLSDNTYDVETLDPSSGALTTIYNIPQAMPSPYTGSITELDGCGVNPADGILYCCIAVSTDYFLARVDSTGLEVVYKLDTSMPSSGAFAPMASPIAGTSTYYFIFSPGGFYPDASKIADTESLNAITDLNSVPAAQDIGSGSSVGASSNLLTGAFIYVNGAVLDDLVVYVGTLTGVAGAQTYLMSLGYAAFGGALQLYVFSMSTPTVTAWELIVTGGGPSSTNSNWVSGWQFKDGRLYFGAHDGEGVYEVLMDTVDLTGSTAELAHVGKLNDLATQQVDGTNCMDKVSPFLPITTTTSMNSTTSTNSSTTTTSSTSTSTTSTIDAALVGNDPFTYYGNESCEFDLPVGKLTAVLHTRELTLLASSFRGSASEQWFGHVVVNNVDGFRLADIKIKKNLPSFNVTRLSPNMLQTLDVTLGAAAHPMQTLQKNTWTRMGVQVNVLPLSEMFLASGSFALDQKHMNGLVREVVMLKTPSVRLLVVSSPASEYYSSRPELVLEYAHLDIVIIDMKDRASLKGILPELWGFKRLSNETKKLLKTPRTVDSRMMPKQDASLIPPILSV